MSAKGIQNLVKEKPNNKSMTSIIEKSLEKKEDDKPFDKSTTPYLLNTSPVPEKHFIAKIMPVNSATSMTKPVIKNLIFDS